MAVGKSRLKAWWTRRTPIGGINRTGRWGYGSRRAHRRWLILTISLGLLASSMVIATPRPALAARTVDGLVVLYDFGDGSGSTVSDTGPGSPLDLTIADLGSV